MCAIAVGKAYEALKTDSKRRYYNMTGEDEPAERMTGATYHRAHLTPEEIFAQVFGGRCKLRCGALVKGSVVARSADLMLVWLDM